MKKVCKYLFVILLLMLVVSCRREDINISQILAQPYIKTNGEMGISVFLRTSLSDAENSSLTIRDPSGNLSWTVSMNKVSFQGTNYYGSSDITMPLGSMLPTGLWSLDMIYKDGRTVSETFSVSYKDAENVLDRVGEASEAFFDSESNLTILPN